VVDYHCEVSQSEIHEGVDRAFEWWLKLDPTFDPNADGRGWIQQYAAEAIRKIPERNKRAASSLDTAIDEIGSFWVIPGA
jgi:hypothetical protein